MNSDFWIERRSDDAVFTPETADARDALVAEADRHAPGLWSTEGLSVIVPDADRVEAITVALMRAGWALAFASGKSRSS